MARVFANNKKPTLAFYELALGTTLLNRCFYFHTKRKTNPQPRLRGAF